MLKKSLMIVLTSMLVTACADISNLKIPTSYPTTNKPVFVSNGFSGIWEGEGYQFNTSQYWTIRINNVGSQSTIEYPSLNCGGNLTILSSSSNTITYKEDITYGSCVDNGKVVLSKIDNNSAKFDWYTSTSNRSKKGATGTVTRTQ